MRSRPGITTSAGRLQRSAAGTALPATSHSPRAGVLSPYHERRHSRATAIGSGTPSLIQSSSATKPRASSPAGSRPAKRTNLRGGQKRVEQKKQALDDVRPASCASPAGGEPSPSSPRRRARHRAFGVKIPGRGEQRDAAEPSRPALRPMPAPAGRPCNSREPRSAGPSIARRWQARARDAGDAARQVEPGLRRARLAPVDDQRAQAAAREMAQKAALRQQIHDVIRG